MSAPAQGRTGCGIEPVEPLSGTCWYATHGPGEVLRWPWRFATTDALGRVVVQGWAETEAQARAAIRTWTI